MNNNEKTSTCCCVNLLEQSANSRGLTLRPIEFNLKPEFRNELYTYSVKCDKMIEDRAWSKLSEIDQIPFQITLQALQEDFKKLIDVGSQIKTPEGTNKIISLMRSIKNLMAFLNSIYNDNWTI